MNIIPAILLAGGGFLLLQKARAGGLGGSMGLGGTPLAAHPTGGNPQVSTQSLGARPISVNGYNSPTYAGTPLSPFGVQFGGTDFYPTPPGAQNAGLWRAPVVGATADSTAQGAPSNVDGSINDLPGAAMAALGVLGGPLGMIGAASYAITGKSIMGNVLGAISSNNAPSEPGFIDFGTEMSQEEIDKEIQDSLADITADPNASSPGSIDVASNDYGGGDYSGGDYGGGDGSGGGPDAADNGGGGGGADM